MLSVFSDGDNIGLVEEQPNWDSAETAAPTEWHAPNASASAGGVDGASDGVADGGDWLGDLKAAGGVAETKDLEKSGATILKSGDNFCVIDGSTVRVFDGATRTWYSRSVSGLQAVVGSEGNFCAVSNSKASAWSSSTHNWSDKTFSSLQQVVASGGNFCIASGAKASAWSSSTHNWSDKTFSSLQQVVASGGNFCIASGAKASAWSSLTKQWYNKSISGLEYIAGMDGHFLVDEYPDTYVWDWIARDWYRFFSTKPGHITGTVWNDRDADGVIDSGESAFADCTVYIDVNENDVLDTGEPATTTGADGSYTFSSLLPSTYHVGVVLSGEWEPTIPAGGDPQAVSVSSNNTATANFGYRAPNTPPVASDDNDYTIFEDLLLVADGTGDNPPGVLANDTDENGDSLTAILVSDAAHGTLDLHADGTFTYLPDPDWHGTDSFTYKANDGAADSQVATAVITVAAVNDPPVLGPIGNKAVDEEENVSFTVTASDPNDSPANGVTLSATGLPAGAVFDSATGAFTWTPTEAQDGVYTVTFTATDDGSPNLSDSEMITVTVVEVNAAPILDPIGNKWVNEQETLTFTATATDADLPADTLTYSLSGDVPSGASIGAFSGLFAWTPTEAQGPGTYTFTVVVSDATATDAETITVTVGEVNAAPVLASIGDKTIDEQTALNFIVTASDPDDDSANFVTLSATGLPAGAAFDSATGAFTWTPTEAQDGVYTVTFTATDDGSPNLSDSEMITVTVVEVNAAPILDPIGNKWVNEQETLTFTATATDADLPADTLTYSLIGDVPSGASIDASSGVFAWTPTEAQGPGTYTFTVVVSDATATDAETITVTVGEVISPPVLSTIGNKWVNEQETLTFTATATDADLPADTLTYSLSGGVPSGASIDASSGMFTWTPTEAQGPGTYTFTVVVSDATATDSETITVTVHEVNSAPILEPIGNKTVAEEETLSFVVTASDPSDSPTNVVTLSVTGLPAGATFNVNTGVFSWTPTETQQGVYNVTFTATDDGSPNLSDSETITITVGEVNVPPVFHDSIPDVTMTRAEDARTIDLNVTDPDGDMLVIAAQAYQTDIVAEKAFDFAAGKNLEETWAGFGYDYRGYQEKYFQDMNTGTWYAILPNGEIHQWSGSFDADSLITTLNRDYWEDPYRLFGATAPIRTPLNASQVALYVAAGQLTIDPAAEYAGDFVVQVHASDGIASVTTHFYVTVTNAPPVFDGSIPDVTMTRAEDARTIDLDITDPDGDTLAVTAQAYQTDAVAERAFRFADGKILEESWAGFGYDYHGHQEKSFQDMNTGTWYAIVPSGEIHQWPGGFDTDSLITTLNRDYWEDPYRLFDVTEPNRTLLSDSQVALSVDDNQLTIEPAVDYFGTFLVQVVASDGFADTTASFLVVTENAAPQAEDDSYGIPADATLDIAANELLLNDYDPDGDSMEVISVGTTANTEGTVVLADGVVSFVPTADFIGQTCFEYVVADGLGGQATGTVYVDVLPKGTLTLSLNFEEAAEGDGYVLGSLGTLDGPVTDDLVVALESGSPDDLTLPATVTIRAGQSTVAFMANIVDDSLPEPTEEVAISATAGGWTDAVAILTIQDNDVPIPGDLDADGFVGSADLDTVRANWGQTVPAGSLLHGDPSGDGLVGSADLDIVRANWGSGTPAAAATIGNERDGGDERSATARPVRPVRPVGTMQSTRAAWAEAIAALDSASEDKVKTAARRDAVDLVLEGWM